MGRKFVITDIHGCAETFTALIQDEIDLKRTDKLYLLGDYIDRGPDSKGVLDFIMKLQEDGFDVHCLRGNHEQFMLDAHRNPENHQFWLENGGHACLKSFNAITIFDVPSEYTAFISRLEYFIELEDFLLVHAGFNFSSPHPFTDTHAMMNIRNMQVDKSLIRSRKILHGHTPTKLSEIKKAIQDPFKDHICLDSGCVYRNSPELGHLIALELTQWQLFVMPRKESVPK